MNHQSQPGPSSYYPPPPPPPPLVSDDQTNQANTYWGAHVMGTPVIPTSHPDNATWSGGAAHPNPPYVPSTGKPPNTLKDSVVRKVNLWGNKAETTAHNVWHYLKSGSSVTESAWGKLNITAKALTTGGGFDTLYKQTFTTLPYEKLKKTFACHFSTTAGPVAGTLYLSNVHVAFCSDKPLSSGAPAGQETWSYYKVMVPLGKIKTVNPELMKGDPIGKYIQIITLDGHDFWFLGFVNHEKASHHLLQSVSCFAKSGAPGQQPLA